MKKIILSLLMFITNICYADDRIQLADVRIQREIYDMRRVYPIYTQVGRTTLVQLEKDESLSINDSSVLGMGDEKGWDLAVRGNNIMFKQKAIKPDTNLIVVTNKRTYSFDLKTASKIDPLTYVLHFSYPDSEAALAALEAEMLEKKAKLTAAAKAENIVINTDYVWRGDNALLKPTSAWDDGRFTRFGYDHAGALPLFFKVLPDGTEAQLNYNIDPDDPTSILLQEVIQVARVRLGKDVIEVVNKAYKLPKFNKFGAGMNGTIRIENGQ